MDNQPLHLIEQFRHHAGMPIPTTPRDTDLFIDVERHSAFLAEEAGELNDDWRRADDAKSRLAAAADALCDSAVFLYHAVCDLGMTRLFGTMFAEIDRSNRTKGHDGKFFEEGTKKLIKGPGFEEPDLSQFFSGSAVVHVGYHRNNGDNKAKAQFESYVRALCQNLAAGGTMESGTTEDGELEFKITTTVEPHTLLGKLAWETGRHNWTYGDIFYIYTTTEKGVEIVPEYVRRYNRFGDKIVCDTDPEDREAIAAMATAGIGLKGSVVTEKL
jgi:hypothetical protein